MGSKTLKHGLYTKSRLGETTPERGSIMGEALLRSSTRAAHWARARARAPSLPLRPYRRRRPFLRIVDRQLQKSGTRRPSRRSRYSTGSCNGSQIGGIYSWGLSNEHKPSSSPLHIFMVPQHRSPAAARSVTSASHALQMGRASIRAAMLVPAKPPVRSRPTTSRRSPNSR